VTVRRDGARPRLFVVTVGDRQALRQAVARAAHDLAGGANARRVVGDAPAAPAPCDEVYRETVRSSTRYLDRALPSADIRVLTCASLEQLPALVEQERPGVDDALALVCIDAPSCGFSTDPFDHALDDAIGLAFDEVSRTLTAELSPYAVLVFDEIVHDAHVARAFTLRLLDQPGAMAAGIVASFTDFVQLRLPHRRLRRAPRPRPALARALAGFLAAKSGSAWGLHTYTGSVVSGMIAELEETAHAAGNPVVRGPSEHSLACAALARWQLDRAPFLIVVTSGMVDEFRGTLANLREAGAKGIIVCGEAPPGRWFPFQGTVHAGEDARDVLRSKGIPSVYLSDVDRLPADLERAFALFQQGDGPVVLIATPAVLDYSGELPPLPCPTAVPSRATLVEGPLDEIVTLLNAEPVRLLWQCGALTARETDQVLEVAREAGIALVDTLARPGTVPSHRGGEPMPEYLGTLSMYGFSARAYEYLHRDGALRGQEEQSVFFLASRIAEVDTPFPPRLLERRMRLGQVSRNPEHLAPFVRYPVRGELGDFLRAVRDRLDVRPAVLAHRRAAIEQARAAPADLASGLPLRPISANYFFDRLSEVLRELIESEGYEYTGVYDVGRGGLSAVRNLPRTGAGFSGWYGRALMGDAVQAIPAVALTRPGNVLAFVGDGGAALVPDVIPSLVQQVALERVPLRGNLSIFRLVDGGHSIIRTYVEGYRAAPPSRQTSVLSLVPPDSRRSFGDLVVQHRRIDRVDAEQLRADLRAAGSVNLYSVILGHNSEGDGLSLLSSLGWQRDRLPQLSFRAVR
jgi:hypothetical protein